MEVATTHRAYSTLEIKAVDDDARVITGIASTPSPDRMGDIVEPKGAEFKLPIPLLWQHRSDSPIGQVTKAKVTSSGIEITASIAKGVSDEIDRAWTLIKSGLVRGLSIGFRGLDVEQIPNSYGVIFQKWEWLELSAVTIPANSEATITSVKQFDIGAPVATDPKVPASEVLPGVTGIKKPVNLRPKEATKMNATEHVAALETKSSNLAANIQAIQAKIAEEGRTKDASEKEEFDNLTTELKAVAEELKDARETERIMALTARPAVAKSVEEGAETRAPSAYRAPVQVKTSHPKGTGLIRLMAAKWIGQQEGRNSADIAKEYFGDMPEIEMALRSGVNSWNWASKAAVVAGNTTDSAWAAPLVVVQNLANEFLDMLRPATVLGRIPNLRRVPFNIQVPRTLTDPTGYWVGQGDVKPVSSMTFDSVSLPFHKLASIVAITEELAKFSSPSAVETVRTALSAALIYRQDRDLLDPTKAETTGINPASLTYGVTPTTASGTTAAAFRNDLGDMLATYLGLNMSPAGIVLVMTSSQAMRLGLMRNSLGNKEFPDIGINGGSIEGIPVVTSENIVATGGSPTDGYPIIALNAPEILLADDGGVAIDISREASLQMNDSPDSPETTSTILVSLWQRNYIGIKAERFVTWKKGRTGAVQFIQNAKYEES